MKSLTMRKSIATLGAATLALTLSVAITPSATAAAPTCTTTAGVETCNGTLANGAAYRFIVPTNFGGTMFFWEHGFRPTYPGVSAVPTGVEELTPGNSVAKTDVTVEMLRAGYGIAAYDGTVKGMRGWNNTFRIEMLKEVIDTAMAKYTTRIQKKVVYGSSQAGAIITPFVEKYPTYADSVGIMAGLTPSPADALNLHATSSIS